MDSCGWSSSVGQQYDFESNALACGSLGCCVCGRRCLDDARLWPLCQPICPSPPTLQILGSGCLIGLTTLASDILEIGRVDGSGIELLGYYFNGLEESNGPVAVDWTTYSWGTPAWSMSTGSGSIMC